MHRTTSTAWFLGGLLLSVISVLLIGYLSIQITGLRGGAVFGMDNQLMAVTTPGPGLVQRLALAAVAGTCVALLVLGVRRQPKSVRALFRGGFVVAAVVQVAISGVYGVQKAGVSTLNDPRRPWVEGWVEHGGMNSAVHLILVMAVFLLVARPHDAPRLTARETDRPLP
jgi:hypothetical protein